MNYGLTSCHCIAFYTEVMLKPSIYIENIFHVRHFLPEDVLTV